METLLTVKHLSVTFNRSDEIVEAVKQLSFSIKKGETVGLVGESGSGKSVTAKAILQLLDPNRSDVKAEAITYEGKQIHGFSDEEMEAIRGKRISMIFQDPMSAFNPIMKVGKQIAEVLIKHTNVSGEKARQETIAMLKRVGISEPESRYHQYPHEFSGGMLQRAMIAMALILRPALVIADEPTTALDVRIQAQILKLMKDLQEQFGMSILLITHDFGVVAGLCDRVVVMRHGEVVETNDVEAIFDAPTHPYTKKLLNALPRMDQPKEVVPLSETGEPLVTAQGLGKTFALKSGLTVEAVKALNFTIYPGETLGLVGESGSGKSTTGRMVMQLLSQSSGEVHYAGMTLSDLNRRELKRWRKDVQIIFQDPQSSLNPRMKVLDLIAQPLDIHRMYKSKQERREKVETLLEKVGLTKAHANRYPHEFSGGQQQRIGIARALAVNPRFIVCDEPLSALDVSIQDQMVTLLRQLQKEFGLTYLFIAHDLAMVKHLCDRVAVMYKGEIVELAESSKLYEQPRHPYTEALLKAVPIPDPTIERKKLQSDSHSSILIPLEPGQLVEEEPGHYVYRSSQ